MKNIICWVAVFLSVLAVSTVSGSPKKLGVERFPGWNKLDVRARKMVSQEFQRSSRGVPQERSSTGVPQERSSKGVSEEFQGGSKGVPEEVRWLEVILKTSEPVNRRHKKMFREVGFEYRSIAGQIVTGRIKLSQIQCLASLEFVEVIEAAAPLGGKKEFHRSSTGVSQEFQRSSTGVSQELHRSSR